jgi:uncharacterized protein YjbJ (UPF0337 family)
MSLENRAEAVLKDIEGKAQAAAGEASGDSGDKIAGNAKQLEAQARNGIEDLKDRASDAGETIKEKAGELKDRVGDAIDNLKAKASNTAEDIESEANNIKAEADRVAAQEKHRAVSAVAEAKADADRAKYL